MDKSDRALGRNGEQRPALASGGGAASRADCNYASISRRISWEGDPGSRYADANARYEQFLRERPPVKESYEVIRARAEAQRAVEQRKASELSRRREAELAEQRARGEIEEKRREELELIKLAKAKAAERKHEAEVAWARQVLSEDEIPAGRDAATKYPGPSVTRFGDGTAPDAPNAVRGPSSSSTTLSRSRTADRTASGTCNCCAVRAIGVKGARSANGQARRCDECFLPSPSGRPDASISSTKRRPVSSGCRYLRESE
jgi:hypothetical protein